MNTTSKAYPLQWPIGWPRTLLPQSNTKFGARSIHAALEELSRQLALLKASDMVISSNVTLGTIPKDRGVCVYFTLKGKPHALPCDRWNAVEDNLWALAKHIEALRGQERWGVGTVERAFAGYVALPSSGENPEEWWNVIGCNRSATLREIEDAFRNAAKTRHPDMGGSNEKMAVLNAALACARRDVSRT